MVVSLVELGDALYGRFGIFRDLSHVADKLLEDLNQKIECSFTDGFYIALEKNQNNRSSDNPMCVFF